MTAHVSRKDGEVQVAVSDVIRQLQRADLIVADEMRGRGEGETQGGRRGTGRARGGEGREGEGEETAQEIVSYSSVGSANGCHKPEIPDARALSASGHEGTHLNLNDVAAK